MSMVINRSAMAMLAMSVLVELRMAFTVHTM